MTIRYWCGLALVTAAAFGAPAPPVDCNAATPGPSLNVPLPTSPFAVVPTPDGCWVFVSGLSAAGMKAGVAVLKRDTGRVTLSHMVDSQTALGLALTHDAKLLVVAAGDSVEFLDVQKLISGAAKPLLGSFSDGSGAASVYANITADDKLLFVSDEGQRSITVIDLPKARANGYQAGAIIGKIPVGNAPIAHTFSFDGKWLYTTSELAAPDWQWPKACKPEGRDPATATISNPEGAVVVVDVARARTDPGHSVVARIPAGCSPVRMAMSPAGDRIYVTARNSNAVLTFDTSKLIADPEHARLGMVPVGSAPVPVAVIDGGRKVIAGNSNRFAGTAAPQSLTILDSARMLEGAAAVLGTVPTGAFPREMAVSADGRTLFVTNFGSQSLQIIDITRL